MKRFFAYCSFLLLFFSLNIGCQNNNTNKEASTQMYEHLKTNYQNPERVSGVNCWWWWLNGNVNKAAITKDLEAMKSRNFQGAMIFDAGGHNQRGNKDIPAGPLFGSDEWNELFVFAMDEAKRLGLEMGFNIQSGWNLGGPRVTPQYTAKQITYSEVKISGNKNVSVKLELPQIRRDFYRNIAVLAFPINDKQKTNNVITDLDLKLGYHELGGSAPDTRFLLTNSSAGSRNLEDNSSYIVSKKDILDLSSQMDANGNLNWKAPEGEWSILRIGYTCTDSHVSTSSGDWQGSVLDYMSKDAFDFYWNDMVEPIFQAADDHVGTTLKYMETDSWEWGGPGSVTFPELMDWSQYSDEGIKYYSGTAVYNKTFNIDFKPQQDKQYFLQLGSVKDVGIAEVKINGKDKCVVWTSPFRVEISDDLRKGENTLEINLVNSWYNRVAGDQTFPDKKQYTSTNIDLKHDFRGRPIEEIPLEPSGLLGPVTVLEAVVF